MIGAVQNKKNTTKDKIKNKIKTKTVFNCQSRLKEFSMVSQGERKYN